MDSTFGARLRSQREQQQITLAAIADQTKIKVSLLEGLERDDVSRWPCGVFRRAYVRSYARAIGLDPEVIVREFLERYPHPDDEITDVVAVANAAASNSSGRPPMRLGFLFGSARKAKKESTPATVLFDEPTPVPAPAPAPVPAFRGIELSVAASVCTRLAAAAGQADLAAVLADAAQAMGAAGLILWMWDPGAGMLVPALSHGYPTDLVAQLRGVAHDGDNAIAAAFRSREQHVVNSSATKSGAVVVPLASEDHCPGVLALELEKGGELRPDVHAFAAILAAQLSGLVECAATAHAATA